MSKSYEKRNSPNEWFFSALKEHFAFAAATLWNGLPFTYAAPRLSDLSDQK
jgi:hypothetical protein